MTPRSDRFWRLLRIAARHGWPCPTNEDLAELVEADAHIPRRFLRRYDGRLFRVEYRPNGHHRRVVFPDGLATDWTKPRPKRRRA